MDDTLYIWTNKRGRVIKSLRGDKGLNALLKIKKETIRLYMKVEGMTYEEAEKEWGTITRVD